MMIGYKFISEIVLFHQLNNKILSLQKIGLQKLEIPINNFIY